MTLLPLDDQAPVSDRVEAETRAKVIRDGLATVAEHLTDLTEMIGVAWRQRDWQALDYPNWDAYVGAEFNVGRIRLPGGERREFVAGLRDQLLSTRAIAGVVGVSDWTVRNDLAGARDHAPGEVAGADGKVYPAARPVPPVPVPDDPSCFDGEVLDAELVDDEPARPMVSPFATWAAEERTMHAQLRAGQTVVVNLRIHLNLIAWAEAQMLFERIDRRSDWGNPFEIPGDGERETVIRNYDQFYLPCKPSLTSRIHELRGKALGCWCAPEPCHGDVLRFRAEWAVEGAC